MEKRKDTMIRKLLIPLVRVVAIILAIPLVLLVLASFLIPEAKVRDRLEQELERATGGQVEMGKPTLRFWPGTGLRLADVKVWGTGQDLARATGGSVELQDYLVDLDMLAIQMAVKPLLRGRLEVVSIQLAGPLLQVQRDGEDLAVRNFTLTISDLSLNLGELEGSVPAGESAHPVGRPAGDAPPGESIPEDLRLQFALAAGGLETGGMVLSDLSCRGDLDARLITLEMVEAHLGEGILTGQGEVDYERDPWGELDGELKAEGVPSGALLAPFAPDLAQRLQCALDGQASGTCNLKDAESVRNSLSLTGELNGGPGLLAAGDWLQEVLPYLGDRGDLVNVRFGALGHQFRVEEGRYVLDSLTIDGDETEWQGEGWIGLDGQMDARLKVKLPPGFTPDLGKWRFLAETLRDDQGRVNLAFRLSGPTDRPRVGLDLAGLR